jgi:hypothetical protein
MTTYSCAIKPIFSARVNQLPHTDSRVITECNIMYYNKSCLFFCIVQLSNMKIQNSVFNKTCIKHMKCSLWRITHAWMVFYVGIVIYNFLFTVQKSGPGMSADCAQWRKLGPFATNSYTEITSCRQNSWHLKGETGYWWKQAGGGLQWGRWKFCHTHESVVK